MTPEKEQIWHPGRQRYLRWFFDVVGGVSLLAFGAALMPAKWFIEISDELGLDFIPNPLTFYLARNLSLLYGFVGLVLLTVARDLQRYHPLIGKIAFGTVAFGLLQLAVDGLSAMPLWWTVGEGVSTIVGGLMIFALNAWCRSTPANS